jgi:DNA mismatch endonuclease, patch repair protein
MGVRIRSISMGGHTANDLDRRTSRTQRGYPMPKGRVKMAIQGRLDPLSPSERLERMSRVRNRANRSTEMVVAARLTAAGAGGWALNDPIIAGCSDFHFPAAMVAVFVDGCFWHGCPRCRRRTPRNNHAFWQEKIDANRRRDNRVRRALRARGYKVLRVWEHEARGGTWINRVLRAIQDRGVTERLASSRSDAASGAATTSPSVTGTAFPI